MFTLPATLAITFPTSYAPNQNKVAVIKSIRVLSGCGLYEAKVLSEQPGKQVINVVPNHLNAGTLQAAFESECLILQANGCDVGPAIYKILQELRELGAEALRLGEDDIANEILQMVLAEKLRRGY